MDKKDRDTSWMTTLENIRQLAGRLQDLMGHRQRGTVGSLGMASALLDCQDCLATIVGTLEPIRESYHADN